MNIQEFEKLVVNSVTKWIEDGNCLFSKDFCLHVTDDGKVVHQLTDDLKQKCACAISVLFDDEEMDVASFTKLADDENENDIKNYLLFAGRKLSMDPDRVDSFIAGFDGDDFDPEEEFYKNCPENVEYYDLGVKVYDKFKDAINS